MRGVLLFCPTWDVEKMHGTWLVIFWFCNIKYYVLTCSSFFVFFTHLNITLFFLSWGERSGNGHEQEPDGWKYHNSRSCQLGFQWGRDFSTHTDNFQFNMKSVQYVIFCLCLFQQGPAGNPGGLPLPFPRPGLPVDFGPNKRRRFWDHQSRVIHFFFFYIL